MIFYALFFKGTSFSAKTFVKLHFVKCEILFSVPKLIVTISTLIKYIFYARQNRNVTKKIIFLSILC